MSQVYVFLFIAVLAWHWRFALGDTGNSTYVVEHPDHAVRDYAACLLHREQALLKYGASGHARVVKQHTNLILHCFGCLHPNPDAMEHHKAAISWEQRGAASKTRSSIADTKDPTATKGFYVDEYGNLHLIAALEETHAGEYFCTNTQSQEVWGIFFVDVVKELESRVVLLPHLHEGDFPENFRPLPSFKFEEYNIEVFTHWTTWTDCDRCDFSLAQKFRRGYCTVRRLNESKPHNHDQFGEWLNYVFQVYNEGVPCKSSLLPDAIGNLMPSNGPQIRIRERSEENMAEPCYINCPVEQPETIEMEDLNGRRYLHSLPKHVYPLHKLWTQKAPQPVKRVSMRLRPGNTRTLLCPAHTNAKYWMFENSTVLSPVLLNLKYADRIYLDHFYNLNFNYIDRSDSGLYSCWTSNKMLLMTFNLTVVESDPRAATKAIVCAVATVVFVVTVCVLIWLLQEKNPSPAMASVHRQNGDDGEDQDGDQQQ